MKNKSYTGSMILILLILSLNLFFSSTPFGLADREASAGRCEESLKILDSPAAGKETERIGSLDGFSESLRKAVKCYNSRNQKYDRIEAMKIVRVVKGRQGIWGYISASEREEWTALESKIQNEEASVKK